MWVFRVWVLAAGVLAATFAQPAAGANLFVNGDFEDLTDWGAVGAVKANAPLGWREGNINRKSAAGQQSDANAIGGSGTSAFLPAFRSTVAASQREIVQSLVNMSGPKYQLTFDFASEDPGVAGNRSLALSTRDGAGNALRTSFLISGDGDFQSFNGSAYVTVLPGAVVFDDDVSITPLVHRFKLTVDSNNARYDLEIIDSNGTVHSLTGSNVWRGSPPLEAGFSGIEFNTFNSDGDSLIDNLSIVTVPEPSAAALVALLCLGAFVKFAANVKKRRKVKVAAHRCCLFQCAGQKRYDSSRALSGHVK